MLFLSLLSAAGAGADAECCSSAPCLLGALLLRCSAGRRSLHPKPKTPSGWCHSVKAQGRCGLAPVALSPFRQVGRGSWRLCLSLPAFVEQCACRFVEVWQPIQKKKRVVNPLPVCPPFLPTRLLEKNDRRGMPRLGCARVRRGRATGVTKQGWMNGPPFRVGLSGCWLCPGWRDTG